MEMPENFQSLTKHFEDSANAKAVFGQPVQAEGRTVIPVAKIVYGFGGGSGSTDNVLKDQAKSAGGGGGGGVLAWPAGVIEITSSGTRYLDFGWRKKVMTGAAIGLAAGVVIAKLVFRSKNK